MQASKLQLDHYYTDGLHFALNERYGIAAIDEDITLAAEDVETVVEIGQNPDNDLEFIIRLTVRLNDKDAKFPYDFSVKMTGFFKVSTDCEPEMIEPLATVNGPSILYGAARELLAIVSARSRFISVFLPAIRFVPMTKKQPEQQEVKALEEGSKAGTAKPRTAKKRATTRKK